MSDTPETDNARLHLNVCDADCPDSEVCDVVVHIEFARKLERERNQLRKLLAESNDIISCLANAATPTAEAWLKQYRSYRKSGLTDHVRAEAETLLKL